MTLAGTVAIPMQLTLRVCLWLGLQQQHLRRGPFFSKIKCLSRYSFVRCGDFLLGILGVDELNSNIGKDHCQVEQQLLSLLYLRSELAHRHVKFASTIHIVLS